MPKQRTALVAGLLVVAAAVFGFFLTFGCCLLVIKTNLARHPPSPEVGQVHGIFLPSLTGSLLAAVVAVVFIVGRRRAS